MSLISYLTKYFVVLALSMMMAVSARAEIMSPSEYVMIMDFDNGDVLFEKNADEAMKPASMAKMMTVYLLLDRLKNGGLTMDDTFLVSEKAWKRAVHALFLNQAAKLRLAICCAALSYKAEMTLLLLWPKV